MPDTPTAHEPDPGPAPQPVARRKRGMFEDPVVRRMAMVATGLVVVFLLTVLSALVSGVLAPTGPRTLAEKELAVGRAAVSQGSTDTAVWGGYIATLISQGDYGRAGRLITDGRASMSESSTADFYLAEARLYNAQEKYEEVIRVADEGMKLLDEDLEARKAAGGKVALGANLRGQHPNFWIFALVKADAYRDLEDWENAIEQYDIYIERNPGAADILIDRGNAKVETGDTKGAEADFRKALKFIPDNAEALAGLDRIGVDR